MSDDDSLIDDSGDEGGTSNWDFDSDPPTSREPTTQPGDELAVDGADPTDDGESSGPDWQRVRDRAAGALATGVTAPLKVVPKRGTIYRKLFGASLKQYHKVGGGDALGLIAEPGQQLDLRPIKYRAPKECDEGERPGWVEQGGDKVWHAGSEGRVVDYIGNVPIVALERDGHVEAGWLKPRIGQAIDLDNYQGVFTNPEITADVVADLSVDNAADTNGALTDGGAGIVDVGVSDMGNYAGAEVVDLNSGDAYDGMRVDFRKASEWAFEQTTTEAMQMQEDRGYLRGQISASEGPSTLKLLLVCAGIILGALGIVEVLPVLLSSSGGGGGINPLTISALGTLL